MSNIIVKSCLDFDSSILRYTDKELIDGFYYYHLNCSGLSFTEAVLDMVTLKSLISNKCLVSDLLRVWKEKESMYSFEKFDDICFSQEYCQLKSEITKDAFSAVLLTDDYEVFNLLAEIVGTYRDFDESGKFDIMFLTSYIDSSFNTSYCNKDMSSLKGYLSARDEFVL